MYFQPFLSIKQSYNMTQAEFQSYRFDAQREPSDEQLRQLMENAAKKVRETNRKADEKFFAELRRASDEAKKRSVTKADKER